jgi:predicted RNase H-like HicB family nuclease
MNKEITFIVHEAQEGGYYAESEEVAIFAEGETVKELKDNIKSGIECARVPLFNFKEIRTYATLAQK